MVKLLEKKMVAPNVHECVVHAPEVAMKAVAGQFVIVIPDEFSERTPLTISDWDKEKGTVTFIFLEVGASTQRLAQLQAQDEIYSFTGPLGLPFELDNFGTVALVGGCYGIGSIYPAAQALKELGNNVICYLEARSKFLLYWNEKIEKISSSVRYATSDGSLGFKGHSYDHLQVDLKKEDEKIDRIMAVGCTYMMYRVSQCSKPYDIKTIVSMNPVMIDGTGMCGACRLEVDQQTKFACVDGPHFDGHKVNWDVVLARRQAYLHEEIISKERW